MALILNIETATSVCSVALAKDGKLLALKEINEGKTHGEVLTLFIQDVFKEALFSFPELDAVAVSKGPGSYTGLRIGVSTAKGLCYALGKPLIGINTLQHLSLSLSHGKDSGEVLFCPMIDARRMEVYTALFDSGNNFFRETSADIIDENSYSDILAQHKVIFFGDGSGKCKEKLDLHPNAIFIDDIFPSAKNMTALSETAFQKKQFEDIAYFEPYYLKDFVGNVAKKTISPYF